MRFPVRLRALLAALVLIGGAMLSMAGDLLAQSDLAAARGLYLRGRYEDARKAYQRWAPTDPAAAAIGTARCQIAVGALDDANRTLLAALRSDTTKARVRAELAGLEFARGNYAAAQTHVDSSLAHDPNQPAARFWLAELDRVAGRLDDANDGYRWFVRFYNSEQERIVDPDVLRWIGLAGAQYARWNRNSGQFDFLVNTLYPDILARDSTYWPAHLDAALLFIEKYNRPDAVSELDAALRINPNAAELHAARALAAFRQFDLDTARAAVRRALAINPRLVQAHQIHADLELVTVGPQAALPILEAARRLDPADEETLGRLAAVLGAIDGPLGDSAATRMSAVVGEAVRRNQHCGVFFAAMGATFDLLQKFPAAARYYEEARRRMPQLVSVPGQLGLVTMRLGDEPRARTILTEAFDIDPFNVRVKNSLSVLDVLDGYRTIETEHFLLRFDAARDSVLGRYASRYLEQEVYPEIVKTFGYAPPDKSLIEIFGSAKGASGHSWFSTRMVGLPFIGTVGACAGKMVAMTSPNDGRTRFNWARVLKHEFVHVVNLQQTHFNIPRWFTEGLAVHHEGPGRPAVFDQVLAHRAASDSLFDLDTINLGFVRPSSGEDWVLAYYQAELYVMYMTVTYGEGGPARMIAAYAANLDTRAALKRAFGVGVEAFEKGYRAYLHEVAGHQASPAPPPAHAAPDTTVAAPAADTVAAPQGHDTSAPDATLLARLVQIASQDPNALEPRVELARLAIERGDLAGAERWARESLDIDITSPRMHAMVARALGERGRHSPAIDEYETAVGLAPDHLEWRLALANECVAAGAKDRARDVLREILRRDARYAGARELLDTLAGR